MMGIKDILKHVDHTQLRQTATWEEIRLLCDDAMRYDVATVCIPPSYVKEVKGYVRDKMRICTCVGFPNGYMTTETKKFETEDALSNGADEIDMVINLSWVKDGKYDLVEEEISQIKDILKNRILKVIVETCLLSEDEKIRLCEIVTTAGADYIKTSTGFSTGGATVDDVVLFSKHIGPKVKIKAAGGISSIADAVKFLELGVDRLGTSRIVNLIKNDEY